MATSGSSYVDVAYTTGGAVAVRLQLNWWVNWQNTELNRSSVHFDLNVITYNYGAMYGSAAQSWNITVNGRVINSGTFTIQQGSNQTRRIGFGDTELAHDAVGNCSFNASGYASFNMNFNGWRGAYTTSLNGTLNNIPRASQPSCITYPNTTQNIGNMGDTITIHANRKSTAFTHTVKYAFGNKSGTIATGVGDNCTWKIPLDLATQVPNATSGIGTITCDTYNGGTLIGTKSVGFTVNVPSFMVPTVSNASVTIDNSSNKTVAGWGLYVQGYSKAKIEATASSVQGATIKSYTLSGGYSTTVNGETLSYTGDTIGASGEIEFKVAANDSRGRRSSAMSAGKVTVYPYSKPVVTEFIVGRTETTTKIQIKANWIYSTVNGKNTTSCTVLYKKQYETGWTTYGEIERGVNTILDVDFSETDTYNFKIVVTDDLQNMVEQTTIVGTVSVLLNFRHGGQGLGIGKVAERDMMEVALPADFMSDVYINGVTLDQYVRAIANEVASGLIPQTEGE